MTIDKLIETIEKIKELAQDTRGQDDLDKDNITCIIRMCNDIETEYKIEKRLENDTN